MNILVENERFTVLCDMWRVGPIDILFLAAVWAIFVHFSQNKSKSTNTLSQDKNKSRTEDFPWWAGASGCYDKIRVLSGKLASVFELFDILKICSNFWLKWRQPFNLILWPGSREYHIYQVYQLFPCIPKEWQISTIIPTVTNGYRIWMISYPAWKIMTGGQWRI